MKYKNVQKMNGGGCYDRLQSIICAIALYLVLISNVLAEVPHTTIAENPNKEVTKVETLKRRDKAELNLTVEKKKSKEIVGYVEGNKVIIPKSENPQVNFEDSYEIMDNLQGKIAKDYQVTTTEKGIEIEGSKVPSFLYLVGKTGTWKWNNRNIQPLYPNDSSYFSTYEFDDSYNGEAVIFKDGGGLLYPVQGVKYISGSGYFEADGSGSVNFDLNDTGFYGGTKFPTITRSPSSELTINVSNHSANGKHYMKFEFSKFPKKQFGFTPSYTRYVGGDYIGHIHNGITFKYKPSILVGQSTLEIREKYPVNEYIKFNSTNIIEGKPLALENSLADVTFNTTGKGLDTLKEKDILEIDGKQVTVGIGGNLGVQTATIGNLKYSYKVEAGKLRLALNEWGVLEPNHILTIRAYRVMNNVSVKTIEHTLTIDSPRRVEGTNNIKVDNNYQIRNVIKFNGISLNVPSSFSLESPIPKGVSLKEQTGYGIPLLDEGDTIQISDSKTRAVHSYTIQSGGTLPSQRIEFANGSMDLLVVNRKVQVILNNWKVNEPMRMVLKAIRGVNEISNHVITLTMPEAPFNMIKTGNLDFGNVLQGAKNKKAESNIRIEMLEGQDVSEVKFNLREEQPVMTNNQGTELKVKRIDKIVQRVRDREYNIKLRGTLDVPEEQQNGEYRGSNILDIEVK